MKSEEMVHKKDTIIEKVQAVYELGTIVKIEKDEIWVDFHSNPSSMPLEAKLGCLHLSYEDLERSAGNIESVKLEFEDGNIKRPIIRDVFCSIAKLKEKNENISINAKKIELKAEEEIHLTCGSTTVILRADEIFSEADNVISTSRNSNRIMGANIQLN